MRPMSNGMRREADFGKRALDMSNVTPGWRLVGVVTEGGSIDVAGLNPWDVRWESTLQRITVAHPSYPEQRHSLAIWRAAAPDRRALTFAAGELSNGVWAFFVPGAVNVATITRNRRECKQFPSGSQTRR